LTRRGRSDPSQSAVYSSHVTHLAAAPRHREVPQVLPPRLVLRNAPQRGRRRLRVPPAATATASVAVGWRVAAAGTALGGVPTGGLVGVSAGRRGGRAAAVAVAVELPTAAAAAAAAAGAGGRAGAGRVRPLARVTLVPRRPAATAVVRRPAAAVRPGGEAGAVAVAAFGASAAGGPAAGGGVGRGAAGAGAGAVRGAARHAHALVLTSDSTPRREQRWAWSEEKSQVAGQKGKCDGLDWAE